MDIPGKELERKPGPRQGWKHERGKSAWKTQRSRWKDLQTQCHMPGAWTAWS